MRLENMRHWEDFYQTFKFSDMGRTLSDKIPKTILKQVLSPVLTIAQAIERWELLPPEQKDITIRWVGAELPELMDGGKWFGLLPLILGRELEVKLCFHDSKVKPLASPNPRASQEIPEVQVEHCGDTDDVSLSPDLVVLSHPDNVTKWKENAPFALSNHTNILAMYWSAIDAAMEREWFKHQGIDVRSMQRNGFELVNKVDTTASWGRFIDLLEPRMNTEPQISFEELYGLGMIRHHSGLIGFGHPAGQPGRMRQAFKVRAMQNTDEYLYVLDDLFLNKANKTLYRFDEDTRQLHPVCEVDQKLIYPVPADDADILAGYRWASKIKLSYSMVPPEKEKDAVDVLTWLQKAAEHGDANAMNSLGQWLEAGFIGEPDQEAAVAMYRRAADCGHASAQHTYADIAFHDMRDTALAARYFQLAADQQLAIAAFNMALLHIEAILPDPDPAKGMAYLKQAADQNEVNAQTYLAEQLQRQGHKREGFEYLCRAADRGSLEAAGKAIDLGQSVITEASFKEAKKLKKKLDFYAKMIRQHAKG